MTTLKKLIEDKKFDFVDPNVTEENFPYQKPRSKNYKLFHFGKVISSENAIEEIVKEGYLPATATELLEWSDWDKEDIVIALGSFAMVRGSRYVLCLGRFVSGRRLDLDWFGDDWGGYYRFLAVRNEVKTLDTSELSDLESLTLRVQSLEETLKLMLNKK